MSGGELAYHAMMADGGQCHGCNTAALLAIGLSAKNAGLNAGLQVR